MTERGVAFLAQTYRSQITRMEGHATMLAKDYPNASAAIKDAVADLKLALEHLEPKK